MSAFAHDPWHAEDFAGFLQDPATLLVENATGFALLRVVLDEAEVLTLAVAPPAQGQGTGTALLAEAMAQAKARGAAKVFLEVAADNARARALYVRAGFAQTGLRRGYYHGADGPSVDAIMMASTLA